MIDIPKTFEELRAGVKAVEGREATDKEVTNIFLALASLAESAMLDLRRIADAADRSSMKATGHYRPLSGEPHS